MLNRQHAQKMVGSFSDIFSTLYSVMRKLHKKNSKKNLNLDTLFQTICYNILVTPNTLYSFLLHPISNKIPSPKRTVVR